MMAWEKNGRGGGALSVLTATLVGIVVDVEEFVARLEKKGDCQLEIKWGGLHMSATTEFR